MKRQTLPARMPGRIASGLAICLTTSLAICLTTSLAICLTTSGAVRAAEAPVPVFVSIVPQSGFAAEIGGDLIEVNVLVGPGHSPAIYEPTPRQMAALAQAKIFFCAGVPFERGLVPKVAGMPSCPTLAGPRPIEGGADHGHGHDHNHPDDIDPHTWLDPIQAMALADTICAHFSILLPAHAADFEARRDVLKSRLVNLDTEIQQTLAPFAGAEFFVFHPAYGHFARRYGLVQVAVEAGGHEPGARQLATVIDQAKAAGAQVIVVQPQFSRRSAQAIAKAVGAEILVLDPLAKDYEANLRHIAASLASVLGKQP
jgi:zinc transport system substrate-binding protein